MDVSLIIPAFVAGLLTFLAPCTLPLVPAYLSFIGGATGTPTNPEEQKATRRRVVINGLFYVIGFSVVFILLGSVFAAGGSLFAQHQLILQRFGGILVLFFGLFMLFGNKLKLFQGEHKIHLRHLTPGKPTSAFLFGATFALGWSPCIGPILGSILILAASTTTIVQGVILLTIFSIGLGLPFMILAAVFGHAAEYVKTLNKWLHPINIIGGILLVFLGILLALGEISLWMQWMHELFSFINYDRLLDYL